MKGSVIDLEYFNPYHDSKEAISNIDLNGAEFSVAITFKITKVVWSIPPQLGTGQLRLAMPAIQMHCFPF